jgi:hypothetical protein
MKQHRWTTARSIMIGACIYGYYGEKFIALIKTRAQKRSPGNGVGTQNQRSRQSNINVEQSVSPYAKARLRPRRKA